MEPFNSIIHYFGALPRTYTRKNVVSFEEMVMYRNVRQDKNVLLNLSSNIQRGVA